MKSSIPYDEYAFMMCHSTGRPPSSTIGLGRVVVSSLMRVPKPPARITAFTGRRHPDATGQPKSSASC
jgi:hypothetical protein